MEDKYRGKRALMMLRVSTEEQKKKYGFAEQESEVREKLITPLGLKLDEEKHIIRDAYTGMVFKNRPALQEILAMAERKEFDVLIMDRLDRLGRKGLQRELYRAELKYFGIGMLTTSPDEHADDDSLMGEMIRLLHGFKSEQERNDIVRRTSNGRRERVKDGKLLPGFKPRYGYKWADPEIGGKSRYIYDEEEKKVVEIIFDMLDEGVSLRKVAASLTEQGILTAQGKNHWSSSTIEAIAKHPFYKGLVTMFRVGEDKSNGTRRHFIKPEEETITINNDDGCIVPPIVTPEKWDRVQEKLERNKNTSPRNNKDHEQALLRCGLIICGHCGIAMSITSQKYGKDKQYRFYKYRCASGHWNGKHTCDGGTITCKKADGIAWDAALEIIRDPKKRIEAKIEGYKTPDPTSRNRTKIVNGLADLKRRQKNLQARLAEELEKDELDNDSVASLKIHLKEIKNQIEEHESVLNDEENIHKKWNAVQERVDKFYEFCKKIRDKLDDNEYEPTYQEKRDALEFIGIKLIVSNFKADPKTEIIVETPSIVSVLP